MRFASDIDKRISLVFLWRLAALCRDFGVIATDTLGFRDAATQLRLYQLYKAGKGNPAAPPGSSWHEASCAVDMRAAAAGGWFKMFSEDWVMPDSVLRQGLRAYGIIAPLNPSDKPNGPVEWWHWQPIETAGFVGDRMKFMHLDDAISGRPATIRFGSSGVWVMELRALMGMSSGDTFDKALDMTVRARQKVLGLVVDGAVGPISWKAFYAA